MLYSPDQPQPTQDSYFHLFEVPVAAVSIPHQFTLMEDSGPHALCLQAAKQLQQYLQIQQDWAHNFGLKANVEGIVIGKMFGVLAVRTIDGDIGYLAAFSGKLAGSNVHSMFVPPVFDALTEGSFLNIGMSALSAMNREIEVLETERIIGFEASVLQLKAARSAHSHALQQQLFSHYQFLNNAGKARTLSEIFNAAHYKNPPAGAGECAGPKLLQHAFRTGMQPLALAEFWWGQSPKSATWQHGHYYPCCREKCGPILAYMLEGMEIQS